VARAGRGSAVASRLDQSREGRAGRPSAPIDRAFLARFTLGNAAIEREVLELFAGHVPLYLEQLCAANTAKAWRNAAHAIKGSALGVGAARLARFAELAERLDIEAEVALAEGVREQAIAAIAEAQDEVCRYIADLFAAA
jgi:HPt (histidine-containing phosphotransfer) domain-containing protein